MEDFNVLKENQEWGDKNFLALDEVSMLTLVQKKKHTLIGYF